MNILIVYATSEGQTRKIAEQVGDWIRARGHKVCVIDCSLTDEDTEIYGFDGFILAGSLHTGKHQENLVAFVKRHVTVLQRGPSAFLSISATASSNDEANQAAARSCIGTFIQQTGWIPTTFLPVGGAIMYTKYGFITRAIMKGISKKNGGPTDTSRDHELTDWAVLKTFIEHFLVRHVETERGHIAQDQTTAIA